MTWISKSITAFGIVLLAHACYSAHEHSALHSSATTTPSAAATSPRAGPSSSTTAASPTTTAATLPVDITIETLAALIVICLGLVLGTPRLRPIQWREWAGRLEREGNADVVDDKDVMVNPFRYLESRPGFVDVRRQRREFAQWVKEGAK